MSRRRASSAVFVTSVSSNAYLVASQSSDFGAAPPDCSVVGGKLVFQLFKNGMRADQAKDACDNASKEGKRGALGTMRNEAEKVVMLNFIPQADSNRLVWLSGSRAEGGGLEEWVWLADNAVVDFDNWNPGEPNNWLNQGEDCMLLQNGRWNDATCATATDHICQFCIYEPTPEPTPQPTAVPTPEPTPQPTTVPTLVPDVPTSVPDVSTAVPEDLPTTELLVTPSPPIDTDSKDVDDSNDNTKDSNSGLTSTSLILMIVLPIVALLLCCILVMLVMHGKKEPEPTRVEKMQPLCVQLGTPGLPDKNKGSANFKSQADCSTDGSAPSELELALLSDCEEDPATAPPPARARRGNPLFETIPEQVGPIRHPDMIIDKENGLFGVDCDEL